MSQFLEGSDSVESIHEIEQIQVSTGYIDTKVLTTNSGFSNQLETTPKSMN